MFVAIEVVIVFNVVFILDKLDVTSVFKVVTVSVRFVKAVALFVTALLNELRAVAFAVTAPLSVVTFPFKALTSLACANVPDVS